MNKDVKRKTLFEETAALPVEIKLQLAEELLSGAETLKVNLTLKQQAMLLQYFELLWRWNQIHNLVAKCAPEVMFARHFFDSLSVQLWLKTKTIREVKTIVDFGTGAGFPGMVLAIANPELKFILLDSNLKKTNFLALVVAALQLHNVTVVRSRAEDYISSGDYHNGENYGSDVNSRAKHKYAANTKLQAESRLKTGIGADVVIARAVTNIPEFIAATKKICHKDGLFVAMKGKIDSARQEGVPKGFQVVNIEEVMVPGIEGQRCLVVLQKIPN